MSPQVSRNLLRIPADLKTVVVSKLSTRPLLSKSCSPFANPLVTVTKAAIKIGICSIFSSFPKQNSGISPSFCFLSFLFCGQLRQQNSQLCKVSSFFVDYFKVWSSDRDQVIYLNFKISENFVSLILLDKFWVVYILFVCTVKSKFLTQFPRDHLVHPVMYSFMIFVLLICCIHLLCD